MYCKCENLTSWAHAWKYAKKICTHQLIQEADMLLMLRQSLNTQPRTWLHTACTLHCSKPVVRFNFSQSFLLFSSEEWSWKSPLVGLYPGGSSQIHGRWRCLGLKWCTSGFKGAHWSVLHWEMSASCRCPLCLGEVAIWLLTLSQMRQVGWHDGHINEGCSGQPLCFRRMVVSLLAWSDLWQAILAMMWSGTFMSVILVMHVARMQWLVYVRDKPALVDSVFITSGSLFFPTGFAQNQAPSALHFLSGIRKRWSQFGFKLDGIRASASTCSWSMIQSVSAKDWWRPPWWFLDTYSFLRQTHCFPCWSLHLQKTRSSVHSCNNTSEERRQKWNDAMNQTYSCRMRGSERNEAVK